VEQKPVLGVGAESGVVVDRPDPGEVSLRIHASSHLRNSCTVAATSGS
jgi:hypothetical protein